MVTRARHWMLCSAEQLGRHSNCLAACVPSIVLEENRHTDLIDTHMFSSLCSCSQPSDEGKWVKMANPPDSGTDIFVSSCGEELSPLHLLIWFRRTLKITNELIKSQTTVLFWYAYKYTIHIKLSQNGFVARGGRPVLIPGWCKVSYIRLR